ncbi:MAG: glycosyltransferase [Verrucomicrobia bacterium]|nr:glycosyltransferase [Verrucomicrobiota bacterium]MBV9671440.1 glycosyltransferase [Verrucomicrobiota bacterium]
MDCLIAIPCFRETSRLPAFLCALCKELIAAPFTASIVVVDDGSGHPEAESTLAIVDEIRSRFPTIIGDPVCLKRNQGKGGAVYAGWNTVPDGCKLLCFVDADGAVPASETRRLIEELFFDQSHRWDALFGSRIKMLGATLERRISRHYVGRIFATFVSILTGIGVYDSQCGLKVIRVHAYKYIKKHLLETRFVFDVELTTLLLKCGFKVREVPINWKEVAGSKVSILKDSVRMFLGILRIRRRLGVVNRESLIGEPVPTAGACNKELDATEHPTAKALEDG